MVSGGGTGTTRGELRVGQAQGSEAVDEDEFIVVGQIEGLRTFGEYIEEELVE